MSLAVRADSALSLDGLAQQIKLVWADTKKAQVSAWEGYFLTGRLLSTARRRFPSDKEYGKWLAAQDFAFGSEWARRLSVLASKETEVRALLATAVGGSALGVQHVLAELNGLSSGLMTSDSDDWHTPPDVIACVLAALGTIDLDPCAEPDKAVPAGMHLTAEDDGLEYGWTGRVFMNPPYGRAIGRWIQKLGTEYANGNVTEAVALLPARTDTEWWEDLPARSLCFFKGRVRFSGAGPAPFPTVAAFLGPDPTRFIDAFRERGRIYQLVES